jgi:hypothetical protein
MLRLCALVLLAVAVAAGTALDAAVLPWPPIHTHTEIQWSNINGPASSTQSISKKTFFYDYPAQKMLVQNPPLSGDSAFGALYSFSSYWLDDTLFMVTQSEKLSFLNSCVSLPMSFGMMRPDWMVSGNVETMGQLFATKQSDFERKYSSVLWTRKRALDGPLGYFNYFSYVNSSDPALEGVGFRMTAPATSVADIVSNEYETGSFVPRATSFPAGTFALPAICANKSSVVKPAASSSFMDVANAVRAHTARHLGEKLAAMPLGGPLARHVADAHARQAAQLVGMAQLSQN